jgi:hypothetical protein
MPDLQHYVIRGGIEGRERLRILARVMRATTLALLDRLDIRDGLACLDGLEDVGVGVVQPMGIDGEVKVVQALTMENIAEAVLQDGLATRAEIDEVTRGLYEFAADPDTLAGVPRVVQAWGRRPAA